MECFSKFGSQGTTRTSTGNERTTLRIALLRLLSHHSGNIMGMIAMESNIEIKGMMLQVGKQSVTGSPLIGRPSSHRTRLKDGFTQICMYADYDGYVCVLTCSRQ